MPTNEILAPSYVRVRYENAVANHNLTLYFSQLVVQNISTGIYELPNADAIGVTPLADVISETTGRMNVEGVSVAQIQQIELWRGVNNAPNEFVNYIQPVQPTVGVGPGTRVASSYLMWVFATQSRQKARFTGFEYVTASPQRTRPATIPVIDDGGLSWYVINGNIPFATQDGLRLTTFLSYNQGYNRKLAKKYGRAIAP